MSYVFEIKIGDEGGDGHAETESVVISSSHSLAAITKAYKAGAKAWGHTVVGGGKGKVLFQKFEDDAFPEDALSKLALMGADFGECEFLDSGDKKDGVYHGVTPEDCARIFMEVVHTQIRDLEYEVVQLDRVDLGPIGYGLFKM